MRKQQITNIDFTKYHDDIQSMLDKQSMSKFIISYFSDVLQLELTYDDVLYLIDNYLEYCYDVTSNTKQERKYSNLDDIVRDSVSKFHQLNTKLDIIDRAIESLEDDSLIDVDSVFYARVQKLHEQLYNSVYAEFNHLKL